MVSQTHYKTTYSSTPVESLWSLECHWTGKNSTLPIARPLESSSWWSTNIWRLTLRKSSTGREIRKQNERVLYEWHQEDTYTCIQRHCTKCYLHCIFQFYHIHKCMLYLRCKKKKLILIHIKNASLAFCWVSQLLSSITADLDKTGSNWIDKMYFLASLFLTYLGLDMTVDSDTSAFLFFPA